MKLMAVLLSICALTVISQEPTKENKKRANQQPAPVIIDTITVSKSERVADTLYLKQSLALDELDSLILEKQKK